MAALTPADNCLLICVQQRSLPVHAALQLITVIAELCHQHPVELNPCGVRLRQAQAPEIEVVGAQAVLDVSQGHVKVALLVSDFSESGLQSRVAWLTCCILQRRDTKGMCKVRAHPPDAAAHT